MTVATRKNLRKNGVGKKTANPLVEFAALLKKYRRHLPKERPPVILVCGKMGSGKTTTINTLFGKKLGTVGYFSRGTYQDEIYEWESETEEIHVVDLPGLGDSPRYDTVFQEIYERRVAEADGFIVVICPPRPAEEGTLKTVRLLINCGVQSENIIFGYNKLSQLNYEDHSGEMRWVSVDGLLGVAKSEDLDTIEAAKQAFLHDLQQEFPDTGFDASQIVEYDSLTGWNLHQMLLAVIEKIPFQSLAKFRTVANDAHEQLKKTRKELLKKEVQLKKERGEHEEKIKAIKDKTEKINNELEGMRQEVEKNLLEKLIDGVESIVSIIDPDVAETINRTRNFVRNHLPSVASSVSRTVSNVGSKIKSFWNSLW